MLELRPIVEHRFQGLFVNLLGWDHARSAFNFSDGKTALAVAQKRGFTVFACEVHRTDLADRGLLRRNQRKLRKRYYEHILIHFCETHSKQIWR